MWVKKSCSFLSAQVANLVSQISERELSWGNLKLGLCLLLLYFFTASWNWLQIFLLHLAESWSCFPTSIWKLSSSQMRLFPVRFLPLIMLTRALFPTLTVLAHGWFPGLQQHNFVHSSSLGWFRPKRILYLAQFHGIAPYDSEPHIPISYLIQDPSPFPLKFPPVCLHASLVQAGPSLLPLLIFVSVISWPLVNFLLTPGPISSPFLHFSCGVSVLFFLFSPVSRGALEQPVGNRCEEHSLVLTSWHPQHKTPTLLRSLLSFTAQPEVHSCSLYMLDLSQDFARVKVAQFDAKDCFTRVCHMMMQSFIWFHIRQNLNKFAWKMKMWNFQRSYEKIEQ